MGRKGYVENHMRFNFRKKIIIGILKRESKLTTKELFERASDKGIDIKSPSEFSGFLKGLVSTGKIISKRGSGRTRFYSLKK